MVPCTELLDTYRIVIAVDPLTVNKFNLIWIALKFGG